jgi:tryptophanyl-tRNA synthetase
MVYPVSQAADILLFSPHPSLDPSSEAGQLLVPVGQDQMPHLEATNKIARSFNEKYGKVFIECTPKVGSIGRLVGTDGKEKMSKSLKNAILLKDEPENVKKMIQGMFTDPKKQRLGDPGTPWECPVYIYHEAFNRQNLKERTSGCLSGSLRCVECKADLSEAINSFLEPIRDKRREAENLSLGDILQKGTDRARSIGQTTMKAVRKAMHLDYSQIFLEK